MFDLLRQSLLKLKNTREESFSSFKYFTKKEEFENRLKIRKEEWFFVTPYGIGDLCIILSLMPEFRKIHNVKKIGIGITNEKHSDVFSIFPDSVNRYEIIHEKELVFCKSNRFEPGHPVIIHPEHIYPSSMQSLIGYKNLNMMDVYKILLNLPVSCKNVFPVKPDREQTDNAFKRFNYYGLKEKGTVLMAPDAFSYEKPLIDKLFWEKLAKNIQNDGFKVAMMSSRHELNIINGVIPVDFPLKEAISFVNLCGFMISNRSGFCDLVAHTPVMKVILYSNEKWHSGSLINGCSLEKMGTAGNKTYEIEVESENSENIIPQIMNLIRQEENERIVL